MQSLDDDIPILQPTCDRITSNWVQTMQIKRFTETLQHKTENDMVKWLMMITGIYNETLQGLGSKIAFALKKVFYQRSLIFTILCICLCTYHN
jgi:succinate-acetate transporter protein